MEFQNVDFSFPTSIRDSEMALYEALWHACAVPWVTVPRTGERVFYFPQGHLEQVEAIANQVIGMPRWDLPSKILCRVINVQLKADLETDEVFAQITLLPEINQDENAATMEPPLPRLPKFRVHSFSKTLAPSDTSAHGGFLVPKRYAEQCFPPLNMSIEDPAQELVARDLQGNQWRFRHIYRGLPRRHLLRSGWSDFVSSKRLVSGDVIVFLRAENGELCVGVQRAMKPQGNVPSSLISAPGMYLEVLANAWEALARKTMFTVSYKPRTSPAEFIIPFDHYMMSMENNYSIGMKFRTKLNCEGRPEQRGTIVGIEDADPIGWPGSLRRCLKVRWDETCTITPPERVSPWEIELSLIYPTLNPLPMSWPASNMVPLSPNSSVFTEEGSSRVTFRTSPGIGFSKVLQSHEFSTSEGTFARINESDSAETSVMQPPLIHDEKIDLASESRSNELTLLNSGSTNADSSNCCYPVFVDQPLETTANPMRKQLLDQEDKHSLPAQLADAFDRIFI